MPILTARSHGLLRIAAAGAGIALVLTSHALPAQAQDVLRSVIELQRKLQLQKSARPNKRAKPSSAAPSARRVPSAKPVPSRRTPGKSIVRRRVTTPAGKLTVAPPRPDPTPPRPSPPPSSRPATPPKVTDRTPPPRPPGSRPRVPRPVADPGPRAPIPCNMSRPGGAPCPSGTTSSGGRAVPPVIATPERHPRPDDGYIDRLPRFEERTPPPLLTTGPEAVPRQLVVLIGADQPDSVEDDLASAYDLQRLQSEAIELLQARAQVYGIADGRPEDAVVAVLASDPRVMLAQRNLLYHRQAGAAAGAARAAQYGLDKIGVEDAHALATGREVKVAVIDTTIDAQHADLKGAIVKSFDAIGEGGSEPDSHGTAVAGIIGARGLVMGVAPDAKLLSVRAFYTDPDRSQPVTSSFILLKAFDWAVKAGADVANLSFSGPRDPAVERAISAMVQQGLILIAAAGNGGPEAKAAYPAAYADVIAVSAHDRADKRYAHANRGAYIALAAPGVDILVPAVGGTHAFMSGTSMAAAHVTGIVALILERAERLNHSGILAVLKKTAEDLGEPGPDEDFGAGRAHALAAVQEVLSSSEHAGEVQ